MEEETKPDWPKGRRRKKEKKLSLTHWLPQHTHPTRTWSLAAHALSGVHHYTLTLTPFSVMWLFLGGLFLFECTCVCLCAHWTNTVKPSPTLNTSLRSFHCHISKPSSRFKAPGFGSGGDERAGSDTNQVFWLVHFELLNPGVLIWEASVNGF